MDVIYGRNSSGLNMCQQPPTSPQPIKWVRQDQELSGGILDAVDEEFTRTKEIYSELEKNRDFAEDHDLDAFKFSFNDWKTELTRWLDER